MATLTSRPGGASHLALGRGFQLGLGVALLAATAFAPMASAADPTPAPETAAPPTRTTCADRFPAEGPAGVDLRLGCIVGELVGLYTASAEEPPTPASTYGLGLLGVLLAVAIVGFVLTRTVARRAGRRLAPVLPGSWWVCDRCRSVNGADVSRCYACGAPPGTGPALPTGERPETPQSFGERGRR